MKPPLDDCMCPICLEILIEPVTMPCQHELCMPCFQHNVQEANFFCPLCRLRISSWARAAANDHKLIDQIRWRQIRKFYPKEVASRMSGRLDYESVIMPPVHEIPRTLSKPGEIRREFEEEMRKFDEQLRLEHEQEETASRQFIEKLQTIEAAQMQVEQNDAIIARNVQNLDSSEDVRHAIKSLRDGMDKESKIYSRYDKLSSASSSTNGEGSASQNPSAADADCHQRQYSPSNKPDKQKILYDKKDIAEFSRLVRENSRRDQNGNGFASQRRPNSADLLNGAKNHRPAPSIGRSISCDVGRPANYRAGPRRTTRTVQSSSTADAEPDSITEEVNHFFRPIDKSPITPPKRFPDGRPDAHPVLLITPIKLPRARSSPEPAIVRKKCVDYNSRKTYDNSTLNFYEGPKLRRPAAQRMDSSSSDFEIPASRVRFEPSTAADSVEKRFVSLRLDEQRTPPPPKNPKNDKKSASRRKSRSVDHQSAFRENDSSPIAKRTRSASKLTKKIDTEADSGSVKKSHSLRIKAAAPLRAVESSKKVKKAKSPKKKPVIKKCKSSSPVKRYNLRR